MNGQNSRIMIFGGQLRLGIGRLSRLEGTNPNGPDEKLEGCPSRRPKMTRFWSVLNTGLDRLGPPNRLYWWRPGPGPARHLICSHVDPLKVWRERIWPV